MNDKRTTEAGDRRRSGEADAFAESTEYYRGKLQAAKRLCKGWVKPAELPTNAEIRDEIQRISVPQRMQGPQFVICRGELQSSRRVPPRQALSTERDDSFERPLEVIPKPGHARAGHCGSVKTVVSPERRNSVLALFVPGVQNTVDVRSLPATKTSRPW